MNSSAFHAQDRKAISCRLEQPVPRLLRVDFRSRLPLAFDIQVGTIDRTDAETLSVYTTPELLSKECILNHLAVADPLRIAVPPAAGRIIILPKIKVPFRLRKGFENAQNALYFRRRTSIKQVADFDDCARMYLGLVEGVRHDDRKRHNDAQATALPRYRASSLETEQPPRIDRAAMPLDLNI
jgi:hypothetical protein